MRINRKSLCWLFVMFVVFVVLCSVGCGGGGGGGGNAEAPAQTDPSIVVSGTWKVKTDSSFQQITTDPEIFMLTIRKNPDAEGFYCVELGGPVLIDDDFRMGRHYFQAQGTRYVKSGNNSYVCFDYLEKAISTSSTDPVYPNTPVPSPADPVYPNTPVPSPADTLFPTYPTTPDTQITYDTYETYVRTRTFTLSHTNGTHIVLSYVQSDPVLEQHYTMPTYAPLSSDEDIFHVPGGGDDYRYGGEWWVYNDKMMYFKYYGYMGFRLTDDLSEQQQQPEPKPDDSGGGNDDHDTPGQSDPGQSEESDA